MNMRLQFRRRLLRFLQYPGRQRHPERPGVHPQLSLEAGCLFRRPCRHPGDLPTRGQPVHQHRPFPRQHEGRAVGAWAPGRTAGLRTPSTSSSIKDFMRVNLACRKVLRR